MKTILLKSLFALLLVTPMGLNAFDMGSAMDAASTLSGKSETSDTASSSALISTLTDKLGITETQAAGGTAALLNEAKGNMSSSDYSSLLSSVPGLSSIMSGSGGSMLSSLGGGTLTDQFSALGMGGDMIGKFVPVLLDYVGSTGGSDTMSMLKGALGF